MKVKNAVKTKQSASEISNKTKVNMMQTKASWLVPPTPLESLKQTLKGVKRWLMQLTTKNTMCITPGRII